MAALKRRATQNPRNQIASSTQQRFDSMKPIT
jgi:hypothetical protein